MFFLQNKTIDESRTYILWCTWWEHQELFLFFVLNLGHMLPQCNICAAIRNVRQWLWWNLDGHAGWLSLCAKWERVSNSLWDLISTQKNLVLIQHFKLELSKLNPFMVALLSRSLLPEESGENLWCLVKHEVLACDWSKIIIRYSGGNLGGGQQSLLNFRQNFQISDNPTPPPPICTQKDCF